MKQSTINQIFQYTVFGFSQNRAIFKYVYISRASNISAQVPLHNAFIADTRPVCKAPTHHTQKRDKLT